MEFHKFNSFNTYLLYLIIFLPIFIMLYYKTMRNYTNNIDIIPT